MVADEAPAALTHLDEIVATKSLSKPPGERESPPQPQSLTITWRGTV